MPRPLGQALLDGRLIAFSWAMGSNSNLVQVAMGSNEASYPPHTANLASQGALKSAPSACVCVRPKSHIIMEQPSTKPNGASQRATWHLAPGGLTSEVRSGPRAPKMESGAFARLGSLLVVDFETGHLRAYSLGGEFRPSPLSGGVPLFLSDIRRARSPLAVYISDGAPLRLIPSRG